jgi:hypothetical protein
MVDRVWPHQIALPESQATGSGHKIIRGFCANLSLCDRGHAVYHEDQWWQVFCFAEKTHAEKFMERFGGEKFDPKQRGKGGDWARWNK